MTEARPRTLSGRVAQLDAQRFVGRTRALSLLDRLLEQPVPELSVMLVHGPAGIGKSTLLRELARRAAQAGAQPTLLDGRTPGVEQLLERAVDELSGEPRPVLLVDTFERIAAVGPLLRERLIPALPERALVVLAGRRAFEPAWFADGWDRLVCELELEQLSWDESRELLARHGVTDDEAVGWALRWGRGLPLALVLAAGVARLQGAEGLRSLDDDVAAHAALVRRLVGTELDDVQREAAAVAAIAPRVDARLLDDVLVATDGAAAERWLASLSFAERVGDAIALHDLVRRALRAELVRRDASRERELRRAVADHLVARVRFGEARLMRDLALLIDNQQLRWGFGGDGSARHSVAPARQGEIESLLEELTGRLGPSYGWLQGMTSLLQRHPELALVARDASAQLIAMSVATTTATAPAAAEADAVLGPWLAHARTAYPDEPSLVWRLMATVGDDVSSLIVGTLNVDTVMRVGLPEVRHAYVPVARGREQTRRFLAAVGAVHHPELDVTLEGSHRLECHVIDYGPGGALGALHGAIYRELGLAAPSHGANPGATAREIEAALRSATDPAALAASPLARGADAATRVRAVRALLERGVTEAFGDSARDRQLRAVLEAGDLCRSGTHEQAAASLGLSRSTYFRLLRTARARVAAALAGTAPRRA